DIGLRLADVRRLGLEGEPVEYRTRKDPKLGLARSGATAEEQAFLVRGHAHDKLWRGQRVELNELNNQQWVNFVEDALKKAGAKKVVPNDDALAAAYVKSVKDARVEAAVEMARREAELEVAAMDVQPPANLSRLVARRLKEDRATPWNEAL